MHHQAGWLSQDAHALQRRLSDPVDATKLHCDLLIVGSGYGGSVAAARLSKLLREDGQPLRVMLIERGREYLPGMFPSRLADLAGHVRFSHQDGREPRGPATALWDMRLGQDVNVVLGSGLGGGSLINAAVMERPEAGVWQSGWPSRIDGEQLEEAYGKVEQMLQSGPLPADVKLPKFSALQHLGDALPERPRVQRCRLAVTFNDGTTPGGVEQRACKQCGDCATGCNWQAKNSLDVNYLALARQRRVDMYCGVLALRIERPDRKSWQLHWVPTDNTLGWAGEALPIRSQFLIVSAGSLGSTELLQRSQRARPTRDVADDGATALRFSGALGSRFSTNGDMLAGAVKLPLRTQICADETTPVLDEHNQAVRHIGPTITGMLRSGEGAGRFVAQEFAIPAPLRTLLAELTGTLGMLQDMPRFDWSLHSPWQRGDEPLSPGDEALDHTMIYGLMGDDGARGRLEPTRPVSDQSNAAGNADPAPQRTGDDPYDGRIAVQWPEGRYEPVFDAQHEALGAAYRTRWRGWYLPNPVWRPLPDALDRLAQGKGVRGPMTTVHPLGGCPMGESVDSGVTDWAGRVFDAGAPGAKGQRVHRGLAVLDGAIVPRALGINPSLTIAALAEHAVSELQSDWKLVSDENAVPATLKSRPVWNRPTPRPEQPATGVRLIERVQGTLTIAGQRYWGEMQVRFSPIGNVAAFARSLHRQVPFEHVVLNLFADQRDRDDEPQWRSQRDVTVTPRFEVALSGGAEILFRHWSWWPCRVWRSWQNVRHNGGRIGPPWRWWPLRALRESLKAAWLKAAIASNIGERRGIDYLLHVDSVSHPDCPLRPGDRLRGRKCIDNHPDGNPWRQLSEMDMQWRRGTGLSSASHQPMGTLALDLRYFVRERTALLALHSQPDMVTALADVGALALLAMRVALKIQLLKFVPPDKRDRSIVARRPSELPGLSIERHDMRTRRKSPKVLLTRYRGLVESPQGPPMVLFHGFTASGSTFAHPSMPHNLVQYLCTERRDVWVVELPTSIAFDKRDARDLSFEEVADLIPEIVQFVTLHTARPKVDVLGHCIGAAMVCRSVLHDKELHTRLRSLTLSQVGPLIQMSPANKLRGYVASYLAQFLGVRTLDARPSFEPGGAGSLGETVLDAVLASLPYPARDRERVLAELAVAQGRPDFRLVRHRSDAMLGRLFELTDDSPVPPATLDMLDDILGYARVQTLAQIIHYTRLSMLTDDDGRNREITSDALSRRMCFPVLLLHGRRSGVFDWRGSLESYEWLRQSYAPRLDPTKARVERNEEKLHLGLETPRQLCVFEKFGHQDSMIGSRAADVVFPVIGGFIRWMERLPVATAVADKNPPLVSTKGPAQPAPPGSIVGARGATPWVARLPWVGPVLGWLRDAAAVGELQISFLLRPDPTHARTRFIAVVPMQKCAGSWCRRAGAKIGLWDKLDSDPDWEPPPTSDETDAFDDEYEDETGAETAAQPDRLTDPLGERMRNRALALNVKPADVNGVGTGWLLLTVHDDMPRRQRGGLPTPPSGVPTAAEKEAAKREQARIFAMRRYALGAVERLLADPPEELESALLRLPASVCAARDLMKVGQPPAIGTSLHLAVASCQYPAGLLDQDLAQASFRRLAARLDAPVGGSEAMPQLLLQLGDQVYVDETAGLFDPVTKGLALDQIYDRSQGAPAFRGVASRLPSFFMLDDHEVRDNWQPPAANAVDAAALAQFHSRQACLNPAPAQTGESYRFDAAPGGWPLFVLDTRTQRQPRTPESSDRATIVSEHDMQSLLDWLQSQHDTSPACPKFVAMPSVIMPPERTVNSERRWSSDGWAAYPASRERLLGEIARRQIRNVVFLAGDAHLSMWSRLSLEVAGVDPVPAFSIVSSGLYAPWRFANAECSSYQSGQFKLNLADGSTLKGHVDTCFHEANGYAVVSAERTEAGFGLAVEFDLIDGRHRHTITLQ